jgi:crotonobetainyl-CoA:carnitine CoA-transferase CaiB-like acyl-CoA transferase
VSGYCAALAVLAALSARGADGEGCAIDLAQLEVLATMVGSLLDAALAGAAIPDGLGNHAPDDAAAPEGVYRCRDDPMDGQRWCAITVHDDDDWRRFGAAIGAPSWSCAARLATAAGRRAHAAELDRLVTSWTRERSAADVMRTLQDAGIAAGLVADGRDLAADPQLTARSYWAELPGGVQVDGIVPRLSATPGAIVAPGPRLGEHTDEVLHELLTMEHSAIARLRTDGIVR